METERNYLYPVGFGTYNAAEQAITLSDDPISIMARRAGETIVMGFRLKNGGAELFDPSGQDDTVITLYKEKYSLKPSSSLAGTEWRVIQSHSRYSICEVGATWKFIDSTMLRISTDTAVVAYVCFGSNVSIALDSDEALFGEIGYDGKTLSLYFGSAFDRIRDEPSVTLERTK
jgi:hypothetical protein